MATVQPKGHLHVSETKAVFTSLSKDEIDQLPKEKNTVNKLRAPLAWETAVTMLGISATSRGTLRVSDEQNRCLVPSGHN